MRKRRTREHVIADLSVNHVERLVLRCDWTVERTRYDYGIDSFMHTYNAHGEVESGRVLFQLKATDTLDAQQDQAFWLNVQDYFRGKEWEKRTGAATTVTVHIPAANVLDEAAIRLFAQLQDERLRPPEEQPPMIARSTVTFAELRQLLLDLGFTESKRGKFWFFEHTPSQTRFAYRPYRARERVTLLDLHITRQDLDWHGLLGPEAFDNRLKKATA